MSVKMGMEKQTRIANMELLRLIAMFMVISLHYLDKGGYLSPLKLSFSMSNYVPWIIEACCIVAVNVYVLISGYFLIESKFRIQRVVSIWGQLIFYSSFIAVVLTATNIVSIESLTLYDILRYIFPFLMNHYWFGTYYILLLFMVPFLNAGIQKLTQQEYKKVLGALLIITSIIPSIMPITIVLDGKGYEDLLWFIVLYLCAGYIRLYGVPFIKTPKRAALTYSLCIVGIIVWMYGITYISETWGKLEEKTTMSYQYNHVLVWLASIALFLFFLYLKKGNQGVGKVINRVATGTFGIYLFHEHGLLRYEWMDWVGDRPVQFTWYHYLFACVSMMIMGLMIDWVRRWIMKKLRLGKNASEWRKL